MFSDIVYSSA